jgi:hypothetical protein
MVVAISRETLNPFLEFQPYHTIAHKFQDRQIDDRTHELFVKMQQTREDHSRVGIVLRIFD